MTEVIIVGAGAAEVIGIAGVEDATAVGLLPSTFFFSSRTISVRRTV